MEESSGFYVELQFPHRLLVGRSYDALKNFSAMAGLSIVEASSPKTICELAEVPFLGATKDSMSRIIARAEVTMGFTVVLAGIHFFLSSNLSRDPFFLTSVDV